MLHRVNAIQFLRRQLVRQRVDALTWDRRRRRLSEVRCKLLARGKGLERHAVPRAALLFHDHENPAHMTRTSNLSLSTSLAAASFALPSSNCVCFAFFGRYTRSMVAAGAAETPSSPLVRRLTSFVFAFLMPISVA